MNQENNKILEEKDRIIFNLKIQSVIDENNSENEQIKEKFKDKQITLGNNELIPGSNLDEVFINHDLSESKTIDTQLTFESDFQIFDKFFPKGTYNFSFKITDIFNHSTREKIEISSSKESQNDKQRIKELEANKEELIARIQKLELEKQMSEQIFKSKAEEMSKNAAAKVEELKEEIKNKAKEELDFKTKYAIQKLIDDLLSPLNNLYVAVEAGANATDPNVSAYVKGFQMLTTQLFNTLESHGISVIQPNIGDVFNPEFHQVHEIVDDATYNKDQVVKLISRGYKLHDRVLKPAIVIVAK